MLRKLILTALMALVPGTAWAVYDYVQGDTSAVLYCPGVQDAVPFDPMASGGSVMEIVAIQDGGTNDGNCLAAGGTFSVAGGSCAPVALTFSGANGEGAMWEKSGVTIPSDAVGIKITCKASDESAQVVPYSAKVRVADPDTQLTAIAADADDARIAAEAAQARVETALPDAVPDDPGGLPTTSALPTDQEYEALVNAVVEGTCSTGTISTCTDATNLTSASGRAYVGGCMVVADERKPVVAFSSGTDTATVGGGGFSASTSGKAYRIERGGC